MNGNKLLSTDAEQGPRILSDGDFVALSHMLADNAGFSGPQRSLKGRKADAANPKGPDAASTDFPYKPRQLTPLEIAYPRAELKAMCPAKTEAGQFSGWVMYGYWSGGKLLSRADIARVRKFGR